MRAKLPKEIKLANRRNWYRRNIVSQRKRKAKNQRDSRIARGDKFIEAIHKWASGNTEKKERQSAMNKIREAVKSGKIKKPLFCYCCGSERVLQGHHADYKKPLDVMWLCSSCHGFLHSYITAYLKG